MTDGMACGCRRMGVTLVGAWLAVTACEAPVAVAKPPAPAAQPTPMPGAGQPVVPGNAAPRLVGAMSAAAWSGWENVTYLPWSRKSRYTRQDGPEGPSVRVDADDSASMLVRLVSFDPRREPIVSWRWRIARAPAAGDETVKDRDDAAARVYFVWGLRSRSDVFSAKGIAYIWGRTRRVGEMGPSPFTGQVGVFALRSGAAGAGAWHVEQRDLEADYRAYFRAPPAGPVSAIALLTDTDHTNGTATAWYGEVTVRSRVPPPAR